ncbi:MAG: alkaline phosphatase [Deltaproteobacteria bacterium]|jgi:alkaline phosphatase|nr:alkaline phosphatase [Deltaproteobacteria bacterium]
MLHKKSPLKAAVAAGALFACLLAASPAMADPVLAVLPIDRAKFLAGQKFDLEVELRGAAADEISIRLNGGNAADVFGVAPVVEKKENLSSYRLNGVTLSQPGSVKVEVTALAGGRTFRRDLEYTVAAPQKRQAKNVILFIGDGMGLPGRQIARILSQGISEGKYNGLLEMERLTDGLALITTSGYDSLVTDSANSASAYATGHKSVVNAMGVYADSSPDPLDDPRVENLAELLKRAGNMSIGLVTTSNITDATPAAFVAHTRRRAEQNFIAGEMIKADVVLGGGSRQFLPQSVPGSRRKDDRNLIEEFRAKGYAFAGNRAELAAAKGDKLLGLFNLDNMSVYLDREILKDPEILGGFNEQPTLMEMTEKAIELLSRNKNGFFLMVEGACIDKQLHVMDWQRSAYDTIEMDKAVGLARAFAARDGSTLILVTADHSHGISITGTYHEKDGKTGREAVRTYALAGFPDFEDKNKDGFPDDPAPAVTLAVQYGNHPDYYEDFKFHAKLVVPAVMADKAAIANRERAPGGTLYTGNIPVNESQEVHTADDVPLSAGGPGAGYFRGVMDNTEVFFGIVRALGVNPVKK